VTPRLLLPKSSCGRTPPDIGSNLDTIERAVAEQAERATASIKDIAVYCGAQNGDADHREVLGPRLPRGGASGVVVIDGGVVAEWGGPSRLEMAFNATKSVTSLVAGIAFADGLLALSSYPQCMSPPRRDHL
jgi:hypothetical protein